MFSVESITAINRIHSSYSVLAGKTINRIELIIAGTGFGTNRKLVMKPAIVLNTTEQVPFEPYHAPITTNLYLPEQIKMVGDEAEYVDYKEQKQHFADGTSVDVTLPALPTLKGTNTLSVGTTVQPSKVYLQGKISEAETVSAEPVQTNVQSLQPLSLDDDDFQLDVMPTESDLQLDVIIPTANLNRIEDDEDAE